MSHTLQTTPTQYVQAANGIKFAYRRLGGPSALPLVMHIHFRANMDFWDPRLINALAAKREVILFDSAGVGRSSGTVPTTYPGWAEHLIAFVKALGLDKIDLLGFSMGGIAVQEAALMEPQLVRRLIVGGIRPTAAVVHNGLKKGLLPIQATPPPPEVMMKAASAVTVEEGKEAINYAFFPHDEAGKKAAEEYWARVETRTVEPLDLVLLDKDKGTKNQLQAAMLDSKQAQDPEYGRAHAGLGNLSMPVFVVNGDNDLMVPTAKSWELFSKIDNATLKIYPHAGHGYIWQFSEEFAEDIDRFLGGVEIGSKL